MFGRHALLVTTGLAVAAGLVLGFFPALDIAVSDLFEDSQPSFAVRGMAWAQRVRSLGFALPWSVLALLLLLLLLRWARPGTWVRPDGRAILAVALTFALGPGLLVNLVLKEHWGRQRPDAVVGRGGGSEWAAFRPWWDVSGPCRSNCSFVSGEVSAATVLVAAAAIVPGIAGGVVTALAIAVVAVVGALRLASGAHFLSDVLLAALFTHIVAILVHRLMHDPRWPPGRPGVVDAWIAQCGRKVCGLFSRVA